MRLHDPVQAFERLLTLVPQVPDEGERELVVAALLTVGEKGLADTQRDRLRKELRQVSKIAQELYEEGREEGREEGEAKKAGAIAIAMLARGLDIGLTAEVTGLSRDAVERLRGQAPS
jgi:predicted transposase/invertase (TIGR01784 family)